MAHFYGEVQGNRGETSRAGSRQSGIRSHTRGWDVGVRVICSDDDGEDVCRVWLTSGSRGTLPSKLIGIFTREDLE